MEQKSKQAKAIGIIVTAFVALICVVATIFKVNSNKNKIVYSTQETTTQPVSIQTTFPTTTTTRETTTEKKEKEGKTTNYLNVRSEAKEGSEYVVATLAPGDEVHILDKVGEWYKILYGGKERYVYAGYVEIIGEETTSESEAESQSESTLESTSKTSESSTVQTSSQSTTSNPSSQSSNSVIPNGTSTKGCSVVKKDGVTYVDGILIANKSYELPESYNPCALTDEAQDAFEKMQSDAEKEGVDLVIISGFRSYDTQERIYSNYVEKDGKKSADTYSARPGHSEHQSGLAMDVNSLSASFGETAEGKWLKEHCDEYGFIIRYPEGKETSTGYTYEPWHIRYLGEDLAKKVTESGLCLEEYLGIGSYYSD